MQKSLRFLRIVAAAACIAAGMIFGQTNITDNEVIKHEGIENEQETVSSQINLDTEIGVKVDLSSFLLIAIFANYKLQKAIDNYNYYIVKQSER